MKTPILENAALRLEPFSEKHLTPLYVSWLNDPVVCRDNSHGVESYTLEKAKAYWESIRNSESGIFFAVILKPGMNHVGNASLSPIHTKHQCADINILLGEPQSWGKGIGYEVCRILMEYAFGQMNLHRIRLGMLTRNAAMIKVCEKLEMTREGIFKEAFLKSGDFFDIVQYAKINPAHRTSAHE